MILAEDWDWESERYFNKLWVTSKLIKLGNPCCFQHYANKNNSIIPIFFWFNGRIAIAFSELG